MITLDVEPVNSVFSDAKMFHAWLSVDGTTVAYLYGRYNEHDSETGFGYSTRKQGVWLWDIETREEYRNQGYSKILLKMVAEHFNFDQVQHDGNFTPEGWSFLRSNLRRPEAAEKLKAPRFRSQNFVEDWDNRISKN